jgi:hypothetical protein
MKFFKLISLYLSVMKKLFLITVGLSLTLFIVTSCESKYDLWEDFIEEKKGSRFTSEHMEYLVSKFGDPIDTIYRADDKEFEFLNINFFWGPQFSKEESERIIQDFRLKEKEILELRNPERIKNRINQLNHEYEKIYYERVSEQKISLSDYKNSYKKKFPELTESQILDSLIIFFEFRDKSLFNSYFEKQIRFLREKNQSYKRHYGESCTLCEIKKDFEVNIMVSLHLDINGNISSYSKYSSEFCITSKFREKFEKYVFGDWIYGDVLGAYKFMNDGTYNMSNGLGTSSGNWWIDCEGSIKLSNNQGLIITNGGIKVGETTYRKL